MNIPLVAHRGYAQCYPENTKLALEKALQLGAQYIEFDLQLTSDNVPVLLHDDGFERTGDSLEQVMTLPWSQVKTMTVGEPARFGTEFAEVTVTPLSDVVCLLQQYPHATAFVEIKSETVDYFSVEIVRQSILPILSPVAQQCVIIADSVDVLNDMRQVSQYPLGWIIHEWSDRVLETASQLQPDYLLGNYCRVPNNEALWSGTWRWVLYDITEPELITPWLRRGADLVETWDIGQLLPYYINLSL